MDDFSSLLSSDYLSPSQIDYFVMNQAQIPGYEYLTRLAIKNQNTSRETLLKLLRMERLAISGIIDQDYRNLLQKRLQDEKK